MGHGLTRIEEEVFSGGGEPTDGARAGNGTNTGNSISGMPGVDRSNAQHQARQGGGASSGGAFEDYDEEEVSFTPRGGEKMRSIQKSKYEGSNETPPGASFFKVKILIWPQSPALGSSPNLRRINVRGGGR